MKFYFAVAYRGSCRDGRKGVASAELVPGLAAEAACTASFALHLIYCYYCSVVGTLEEWPK